MKSNNFRSNLYVDSIGNGKVLNILIMYFKIFLDVLRQFTLRFQMVPRNKVEPPTNL